MGDPLYESVIAQFFGMRACKRGQGGRIAPRKRRGPLRPVRAGIQLAGREKKRVVIQPVAMRLAELIELGNHR
jgi:hypothetical protein